MVFPAYIVFDVLGTARKVLREVIGLAETSTPQPKLSWNRRPSSPDSLLLHVLSILVHSRPLALASRSSLSQNSAVGGAEYPTSEFYLRLPRDSVAGSRLLIPRHHRSSCSSSMIFPNSRRPTACAWLKASEAARCDPHSLTSIIRSFH